MSIYDDILKSIIIYIVINYCQRVYTAFEYNHKQKETKLINKPTAPMVTKVMQAGDVKKYGEYKVMGESRLVLDRDREDFVMYQFEVKQYTEYNNKVSGETERCYILLIGQCSPSMEHTLYRDKDFKKIK